MSDPMTDDATANELTEANTVGGVIADVLARAGVRHFFLLTGGDNAFLMELQSRKIMTVLARSERSAAFMADAYARLSGGPGFVYGQFGPGAAVLLSGLIDAGYGHSPVVALCSEVRTGVRNRFAYQELEQIELFRTFTKYCASVGTPERCADTVLTAIRTALAGCPGPCYVGVPSDVLVSNVEGAEVPGDHREEVQVSRPRSSPGAVAQAAELIAQADRPIVLAGSGCHLSGCYEELERFATATAIPVVTTAGGKGAVGERASYAMGVGGRYGRLSANAVIAESDLIMAIGTRLNDMTTNRGRLIARDARVIHVDVDPAVFGRNRVPDLAIVSDAAAFLDDLASEVKSADVTPWSDHTRLMNERWLAERKHLACSDTETLAPIHVVTALRDVMAEDDILVSDTGYMAAWSAALFDVPRPGLRCVRTAGSLGWSVPAAIGAQLAMPRSRVVALTGDGGLGYHVCDIETAARLALPIVFVVLNNGMLAFERHAQLYEVGRWSKSLTNFTDCDYAAVAAALGAWSATVRGYDELPGILNDAFKCQRPAVIDVRVAYTPLPPITNFDADRPL